MAEYEADRLGFLLSAQATYGGVVAFDTNTTIVNAPTLAVELLDNRSRIFDIRANFLSQRISAEDARQTLRARRHLNPGLRRIAVEGLGDRTRQFMGNAFAEVLRTSAPEAALDPLPLLEEALSRIVSEFYFGDEWELVRDRVGGLMDALSAVFGSPFALPAAVPSPSRLRIKRRYAALRVVVDELLRARTHSLGSSDRHDFAARVAHAGRSVDGLGISRISDLIIGSLLAAHRVPAAAVAWAMYELGCDPGLQRRLESELGAGLALASTRPRSSPSTVLSGLVLETLRLHPPTWLLRRTASSPVSLGGFAFPAGHHFLVSPYVLHRDESQFRDAEAFLPERWQDGHVPQAFMPYGRGQHACPGSSLATVMMTASVEALLRSCHIREIPRDSVEPDPRSTLRPKGLRVHVIARANHPTNPAARQLA